MSRRLLLAPLPVLMLLAACDRQPGTAPTPRDAANSASGGEAEQIDALETRIRLQQAEKRIAELERQVGELRDNPQTLDLELLRKRLEAVEARVYANSPADSPRPRDTQRDTSSANSAAKSDN